MTNKFQLGKWLSALAIWAALTLPVFAQHPRGNSFQQNPNRPPKVSPAERQQRQQAKQQRQQEKQAQREAQKNANRPPQTNPESRAGNPNRPSGTNGEPGATNPNRPPNAYTPPPARKFDNLNPQEKQRALNNYKDYEKRTPAERQRIQESKKNWDLLTSDQKSHIKNEVFPKWRQLPSDRQHAISSRLNVLQNMPESARNQHLNDPNFTRGMNEDDKSMLRDLSHLHVGGAPEPPRE